MKKMILAACCALLLGGVIAAQAEAGISVGAAIDSDGVKSFHVAVGDHFRVQEKEVLVVRKRNIPDDELPVVFFLAARAKVAPGVIVDLRLGGKSWMDITAHYGLGPDIYYVPLKRDPGPPYGKAWGHIKKHKANKKHQFRLADADIVNFVNLKFIAEHHGCSPDEVVKMRANKQSFVSINKDVKAQKNKQKDAKKKSGKGKGKKKG